MTHQNLDNGLTWTALWAFCFGLALGAVHVERNYDAENGVSILYTDAAATNKAIGVCNYSGDEGITIQLPEALLEQYARPTDAQQVAELYGVAIAVTAAATARRNTLIFTDNKACEAWFRKERIPATRKQTHLLLASSILQTLHSVDCTVRWSPGLINPADFWSRQQLNVAHGL